MLEPAAFDKFVGPFDASRALVSGEVHRARPRSTRSTIPLAAGSPTGQCGTSLALGIAIGSDACRYRAAGAVDTGRLAHRIAPGLPRHDPPFLGDSYRAGLSPVELPGDDVVSVTMDDRSDEAVYRAHSRELVRFATGLVGPDDAPDVVVEAFVRVSSSEVWGRACDRRTLWYRAVVFEAISWKRSAARRRAREARMATTAPVVPAEDGDDRVVGALDVLSPQQRAVVMLTYWADLDPPGVARLLGVSDGAVRKQLARARQKLKGELGDG